MNLDFLDEKYINSRIRKFFIDNIEKNKLETLSIYHDYFIEGKSVNEIIESKKYSVYAIENALQLKYITIKLLNSLLSSYIIPCLNNHDLEKLFYRLITNLSYFPWLKTTERGRSISFPYRLKLHRYFNILFSHGLRTLEIMQIAGFVFMTQSKPVAINGTYNRIDKTVIFDNDTYNYLKNMRKVRIDIIMKGFKLSYLRDYKESKIPYFYIRHHGIYNKYIIPFLFFLIYSVNIRESIETKILDYFIDGIILKILFSNIKVSKYFEIDYFVERLNFIENNAPRAYKKMFKEHINKDKYQIINLIHYTFLKRRDKLMALIDKRKKNIGID